jgi:hypothetical protein
MLVVKFQPTPEQIDQLSATARQFAAACDSFNKEVKL